MYLTVNTRHIADMRTIHFAEFTFVKKRPGVETELAVVAGTDPPVSWLLVRQASGRRL